MKFLCLCYYDTDAFAKLDPAALAKIPAACKPHDERLKATGKVMTVEFRIAGQDFIALNGGPIYKFSEAVSFSIECETQKEIDYYWERLLAGGGKPVQCGWLRDRYGLSWQVVPKMMGELFTGKDPKRAERAMQAMLKMVKLDIRALKAAAR